MVPPGGKGISFLPFVALGLGDDVRKELDLPAWFDVVDPVELSIQVDGTRCIFRNELPLGELFFTM